MAEKQTIVVKLGGSLLNTLPASFFQECASLQKAGVHVVIVHGGGLRINDFAKQLSLEAKFVNGLRVTDEAVLELVEMVLGGSINKQLVSRLEQAGCSAVGISGVDRNLIRVRQQDPRLGFVGEVEQVNVSVLHELRSLGWIPVVASLGVDGDGQHYNINADTAAGAVAKALKADCLVLATDVPGILAGDGLNPIDRITPGDVARLIDEGVIRDGMIPKVKAAAECVANGVQTVCIADGRAAGFLAGTLSQHDDSFPGTKVVAEGCEMDGLNGDVHALAHRAD
ncbi:acetylglutamate kinase [Novibacillus thermophilus]|jgi:acetylglutamate kinase|uniref:Acetylglutamate kinase n=1 Tax=Novibacillus thermophilus TaxID=1471761 RepID=A0A1U9KAI1_9BACL|nr:acetylglutamate kinase [Novibacillus thermophilus]AQS57079.1 acetylglutamate kinase [Novibacillus thermophilus]